MDQEQDGLPNLRNATRKIQKKVVQVWKITIFNRQTELGTAITLGFPEVCQPN
jgi:hypothetical protein